VEALVQQKGLTRDVFFSPSVPREAVVPFYQVADVFLLTSNFEGMPMSVLEALACGTPVVTTPVGEVGKVVRNGSSGEITVGFQTDDIVKAVTHVLTDPERYPSEVCVEAIEDYVPAKVLQPVYEKIRAI
jgi:glycosyltransferase involved in cell wall biosynthesis